MLSVILCSCLKFSAVSDCYKSRISPLSKKKNCMWRCVVISWQGKIIFHESNEFWIELQTTIPDGQVNNSEVKATYSSFDNETILLQVVSASLYNGPFYSSLCKTCFLYQEILLWLLHILAIQLYCLHKRHRFFVPPHQSEPVWLGYWHRRLLFSTKRYSPGYSLSVWTILKLFWF